MTLLPQRRARSRQSRVPWPAVLIVASAACWAALALVAWGTGPSPDTEDDPAVAYDSDTNQFLVAYERVVGNAQIHVDRFDSAGNAENDELQITSAGSGQFEPDVAYDPTSGDFLLVWIDAQLIGIRARPIDAAGDPSGSLRTVDTGQSGYSESRVAANTIDGGGLVTWRETGGDEEITARRVQGNGATQGSRIIIDNSAGSQVTPDVAFDPGNARYLVVYDYDDASGGIQGRLVDASNGDTGSILTGISAIAAGPRVPDLAFDADNGRYFVIWHNEDTDYVEGRLLDADGAPLDDAFEIALAAEEFPNPAIAFDPISCEYLVVWEDNDDNTPDIVGQRFDVGGNTSGGSEVVIANGGNGMFRPALAANATDGGFLVVAVDANESPEALIETFVSASAGGGWTWPPRGGTGWLGVGLAAAALMGLLLLAAIRRARPLRPALATTLAVLLLNVAVLGVVAACDTSSGGGGGSEHSCLEE